jgi:hypothetical protein
VALQRGHLTPLRPEVSDFRTLTRADLALLSEKRPAQTLQTLRDTHHRVARAVAAGLKTHEVATHCGISLNRVSMLKKDPAFTELVAHYRGIVTAEYVRSVDSFMEVATSNMLKAAVMISDKLDDAIDKGEFLPTRDLIAIHDTGADRFGYGKMQKNLNVNVDFASQLEKARRRSSAAKDISPPLAPQIEAPSGSQSAPAPASASLSRVQGPSTFRRV